MRIAWNVMAFIAVANLLGLALLLGWLGMSGRVDNARLEKVRAIFSEPVELETARLRQAELAANIEQEAAAKEASLMDLSAGSRVPIDSLEEVKRRKQMILRNLSEGNTRDQRLLLEQVRDLDAREEALAEDISAFEQRQEAARSATQAVAFQDVVKLLEALPPRDAKDLIVVMAMEGRYGEAVGYLRAMRAGARTEIFAALKTEEERKVASALLDRMRGATSEEKSPAETIDAGPLAQSDSD